MKRFLGLTAVFVFVLWWCSVGATQGEEEGERKVEFLGTIRGDESTGPWDHVSSIFFDPRKARLYVADMKNHRLLSYDDEFRFLSVFDAEGKLVTPFSMVRDSRGRFFVTARKENCVLVIDVREHRINRLDLNGIKGRRAVMPGRMTIDDQDQLYMIDEANRRILLFQGETFLKHFGKAATGFNDVCSGPSGRIHALDSLAGSVAVFSREGEFIFSFGARGKGEGEFHYPSGLAVDSRGRIYVADQHRDQIMAFNAKGHFLFSFSGKGWREGRLNSPSCILFDQEDRLYVVDRDNERVQVFKP